MLACNLLASLLDKCSGGRAGSHRPEWELLIAACVHRAALGAGTLGKGRGPEREVLTIFVILVLLITMRFGNYEFQ